MEVKKENQVREYHHMKLSVKDEHGYDMIVDIANMYANCGAVLLDNFYTEFGWSSYDDMYPQFDALWREVLKFAVKEKRRMIVATSVSEGETLPFTMFLEHAGFTQGETSYNMNSGNMISTYTYKISRNDIFNVLRWDEVPEWAYCNHYTTTEYAAFEEGEQYLTVNY